MTVTPPTDRHGVKLECGQRVRAETAWGEVVGLVIGLRGTVPAWVTVLRPTGEWSETMVMADRCEIIS